MSEDIYSMTDQPTTAPLDLREFLRRASDPSIPGWERVVDAKHAATVIEQMAVALEDPKLMWGPYSSGVHREVWRSAVESVVLELQARFSALIVRDHKEQT